MNENRANGCNGHQCFDGERNAGKGRRNRAPGNRHKPHQHGCREGIGCNSGNNVTDQIGREQRHAARHSKNRLTRAPPGTVARAVVMSMQAQFGGSLLGARMIVIRVIMAMVIMVSMVVTRVSVAFVIMRVMIAASTCLIGMVMRGVFSMGVVRCRAPCAFNGTLGNNTVTELLNRLFHRRKIFFAGKIHGHRAGGCGNGDVHDTRQLAHGRVDFGRAARTIHPLHAIAHFTRCRRHDGLL